MKLWSSWYDEVMPNLPGDPPLGLVDSNIRNAAIKFFDFAGCWTKDLGAVVTTSGTAAYILADSTETDITAINKILSSTGAEVTPTTAVLLNEQSPGWELQTGEPNKYIQLDETTIRLYPTPNAAYSLSINVSLKPSKISTGVPDEVFNDYCEDIKFGTLERLFLIPKKPWSDPQLAAYYKGEFAKSMGEARVTALKNFTNISLDVTPRRFG